MSRQAMAATTAQLEPAASPYGALFPAADQETGLPLLKLPRGFTYRSFSWTGDAMSDGNRVHGRHDGMAAVARGGNGGCHESAPDHYDSFDSGPGSHHGNGLPEDTIVSERPSGRLRLSKRRS